MLFLNPEMTPVVCVDRAALVLVVYADAASCCETLAGDLELAVAAAGAVSG